jgi:hypothetical protein
MKNSGYVYRGKESPNLNAENLSVCRNTEIASEGCSTGCYPRAISDSICDCNIFIFNYLSGGKKESAV